MAESPDTRYDGSEIAIIGMACRFPGASTIEELWRNLVGGVESLTVLTDEELIAAGVDPKLIHDPRYVRRASLVDNVEWFDPAFFGYTPLEAKLMDPQHRLFLECAWEVFEQAGYDPEAYGGRVGVFTGAKTNTYLLSLFSNRDFFRTLDSFQIALGNDLAAMATRVSYKFNLRGPSYALHTACSTSLVAVHLACQSLQLDECRMAVAGGAAVNIPYRRGYAYQKGGILSPDGSCRTFDEQAQGSNFGNGAGAVLLKRLEDAIADGDHVYALVRGSATNNDGSLKASYTAPGVEGQTDVLIEAMAAAGVDADTISYVEAHGTATDLGDSIEMLALTEAFRASTPRKGFCAVGSIKTNIGHLETAAGVAGLIKTAMALERKVLPPSLHFQKANPKIDFENSPFYVNAALREWEAGDGPRRAGVSSFGIGSTNAHVILEEPPAPVAAAPSRPWQLLVLSARTETALDTMTANLAGRLKGLSDTDLPDVAYTLQVGRRAFPWRRIVVCQGIEDAVAALEGRNPERVFTHHHSAGRPAAFLFPGLGDHHVDMGLGLYRSERVFRETVDRCAEVLKPILGVDLRDVLYPGGGG
ncbi:MAG TPA: type I polyketide synthase, partial [Thermoanaerobaculia bacterium]|nr:type I polyketide synthase [Thermoanaerobaculia bacterium]